MSNFVEQNLQHNSTIFNEDWPSFFCKICRTVLSYKYDSSFRQHLQTVFDNIRQKILSNAGEKCLMPLFAGEKWCQKILSTFDNIFRQLFSTKFYRIWQIFCQIMSKFVLCWRNLLAKNAVENYWQKMLSKNAVGLSFNNFFRQISTVNSWDCLLIN